MKNRYLFSVFAAAVITVLCVILIKNVTEDNFSQQREAMVGYLSSRQEIKDGIVLAAMRRVKRHMFVAKKFQSQAYEDISILIGYGQPISPGHAVALMTQSLELKGDERVLEIGTGSGYQAAVLAEIVKEVYTIEIIKELADSARRRLRRLGYKNIKVKYGDGFIGWPEYAPYDAIIVTAAVDKIPDPLINQLAEGGRMIIPLYEGEGQEYRLVRKVNGRIIQEIFTVELECGGPHFVPMTGKHTGISTPTKETEGAR